MVNEHSGSGEDMTPGELERELRSKQEYTDSLRARREFLGELGRLIEEINTRYQTLSSDYPAQAELSKAAFIKELMKRFGLTQEDLEQTPNLNEV